MASSGTPQTRKKSLKEAISAQETLQDIVPMHSARASVTSPSTRGLSATWTGVQLKKMPEKLLQGSLQWG
ncbi:unnamed protein product [Gadus morhua 'NCC']